MGSGTGWGGHPTIMKPWQNRQDTLLMVLWKSIRGYAPSYLAHNQHIHHILCKSVLHFLRYPTQRQMPIPSPHFGWLARKLIDSYLANNLPTKFDGHLCSTLWETLHTENITSMAKVIFGCIYVFLKINTLKYDQISFNWLAHILWTYKFMFSHFPRSLYSIVLPVSMNAVTSFT